MKDRLQLRRPPDDHDLGSLLMLAITAGAFLLITWVATKALFAFLQEASIPSEPIGKRMSLPQVAISNWECSTMLRWSFGRMHPRIRPEISVETPRGG